MKGGRLRDVASMLPEALLAGILETWSIIGFTRWPLKAPVGSQHNLRRRANCCLTVLIGSWDCSAHRLNVSIGSLQVSTSGHNSLLDGRANPRCSKFSEQSPKEISSQRSCPTGATIMRLTLLCSSRLNIHLPLCVLCFIARGCCSLLARASCYMYRPTALLSLVTACMVACCKVCHAAKSFQLQLGRLFVSQIWQLLTWRLRGKRMSTLCYRVMPRILL